MLNRVKALFLKIEPKHIVMLAGLIVLGSFFMIYLIDMQNVLGTRDFLMTRGQEYPYFWYHWYRNTGPMEMLQYATLGAAAFFAIKNASLLTTRENNMFWSILGVAYLFMLIEDAASPRHRIRQYVGLIAGEEGQGTFGTLTELVYFAVLAAIPVYALLRYGLGILSNFKSSRTYMLLGFVVYAMAAGASFAGSAFDSLMNTNVYTVLGENLFHFMIRFSDGQITQVYLDNQTFISFFLMDAPVEESIELMGASLMLAAGLAFRREVQRRNKS